MTSAAENPTGPLAAAKRARATGGLVMIAAVILLAFNLRPAVNALGVALQEIQADIGLTDTAAGILTALPTLSFALVGFAVSPITARLGARWAVLLSLVVLTGGQLLRVTGSTWALFTGSALALGAITFGNVLLPGLIRQYFPTAIGPMTALYTTVLMTGQTLGAGLTPPLQNAMGGTWRLGIGMWAATAAIALVPWTVALVRPPGGRRTASKTAAAPAPRAVPIGALARSPRAWAMAVFFGMQSLQAYVVFGWVPTVLTEAGLSSAGAAGMLSIITGMSIPMSALVPTLLGRFKRHDLFIVGFISAIALGYLGLLLIPATATYIHAVLIGLGLSCFAMALMLFPLRSRGHLGTTALSGFGQSVGYLLASIGPIGFGYLHDLSGGSTVPLIALIGTLAIMLVAGLIVVRDWKIEDDLPPALPS